MLFEEMGNIRHFFLESIQKNYWEQGRLFRIFREHGNTDPLGASLLKGLKHCYRYVTGHLMPVFCYAQTNTRIFYKKLRI